LQRAGKTVEVGTFRIDPTRKPRALDIYPTRPEGHVQLGICAWDGDKKLKVCYTHPGTAQTRPSLFSVTKGTGHVMSMFKREKPLQEAEAQAVLPDLSPASWEVARATGTDNLPA